MPKYLLLMFFASFFIASCTQFLDDQELTTHTYNGDDGCIDCHTNKMRLQALAPATDDAGGAGGG
jgi:hypothetical protein